MKTFAAILATISFIIAWASGVVLVPSLICLVLKLAGVPFLAGMSYWFPLQVFGIWVTASLTGVLSGLFASK